MRDLTEWLQWLHKVPRKSLHAAAEGAENEGNQRLGGACCRRRTFTGGTICASAQILWYLGLWYPRKIEEWS